MISPGFAPLLCFVQSDAALSPETCDLLLGVTVKRSSERVSVDGQLSTSDTVILQCSGASGVAILERVMGLILAAIAVQFIADGGRDLLSR